jgi:hypothetical protein
MKQRKSKGESKMSWSVSASGEPKEVAAKLEKDFQAITYLQGPEKGICESAAKLVAETLAGYDGTDVSVTANGHAGIDGPRKYQNLQIVIQPKGANQ